MGLNHMGIQTPGGFKSQGLDPHSHTLAYFQSDLNR